MGHRIISEHNCLFISARHRLRQGLYAICCDASAREFFSREYDKRGIAPLGFNPSAEHRIVGQQHKGRAPFAPELRSRLRALDVGARTAEDGQRIRLLKLCAHDQSMRCEPCEQRPRRQNKYSDAQSSSPPGAPFLNVCDLKNQRSPGFTINAAWDILRLLP